MMQNAISWFSFGSILIEDPYTSFPSLLLSTSLFKVFCHQNFDFSLALIHILCHFLHHIGQGVDFVIQSFNPAVQLGFEFSLYLLYFLIQLIRDLLEFSLGLRVIELE